MRETSLMGSMAGMSSLPPPRSKYLRKRTKSPHRSERGKSATSGLVRCNKDRLSRTFADHHKWRPVCGMRVAAAGCDECQHGPPQRLCAADLGVGLDLGKSLGDQFYRCIGVDRPMRGEQRSGTGVEKSPR